MRPLNILIIEDELITATDILEILQNVGHTAQIAKNAQSAVQKFSKNSFDLVLCDITLKDSDKNGIELAKELKNLSPVPIIFLTAHSENYTFRMAKEVKPAAYIIKPFREIELNYQIELAYLNAVMSKNQTAPLESDSIYFPNRHEYVRIKKSDIVLIQSNGSYIDIFLKGEKKPFQASMNMGYIDEFLQFPNFYRVSRFHIINLNHLQKFDAVTLYMESFPEIGISIPKSKKGEFLKKVTVLKTPR